MPPQKKLHAGRALRAVLRGSNFRSVVLRWADLSALTLLVLTPMSGCAERLPPGVERGRELYATCAPCHGEDASGHAEYAAPAIAGLEAWYLERQLEHFRLGARGSHPDDVNGLRMRPMVQALRDDDDLRSVAAYLASLSSSRPPPELAGGNSTRGRELYGTCAECHGSDGAGDRERGAPRLVYASDWYLLAQLRSFRSGFRGTDPRDDTGASMRPMAMTLADEQALRDVVAYITTLSGPVGDHGSR